MADDTNVPTQLAESSDEIVRLREREQDLLMKLEQDACEIERLRGWIDRQEPDRGYEKVTCPMCHRATEDRFWRETEQHAEGCPWREEARRG